MAGWAGSASSTTFSGSVGGPLGLPIKQLLLLLLDPVGVIVGFLTYFPNDSDLVFKILDPFIFHYFLHYVLGF